MGFLEIIKIVLLGIVEGITEWLPISSTGHMIVLESLLDVKSLFTGGEAFWQFFLVAIQLGAILAVIVLYFNKLNPFFGKSLKDETVKKDKQEKKEIWILWSKVLIACLPAAVVGLVLDDWMDAHLYNVITVSTTLIVYGVLFIVLEIWNKKRKFKVDSVHQLSYRMALMIGGIQLLALIPGTSRSGVTILGAMLLLCNREVAAEFSFFLSIPIMVGASLFKSIKYIMHAEAFYSSDILLLLIGCVVAFAVSIVCIKLLMSFIKKHDFKPFGIYRIVLGCLLIILLVCGVVAN